MTLPDPGQVSVNQADYIATLEEDLAREAQARRLLTAMLAQCRRTVAAYVERYGDITAAATSPSESTQEVPDGAAAAAG